MFSVSGNFGALWFTIWQQRCENNLKNLGYVKNCEIQHLKQKFTYNYHNECRNNCKYTVLRVLVYLNLSY